MCQPYQKFPDLLQESTYCLYGLSWLHVSALHVISSSPSLGPVINILAIFSNANILKNKRIKIYHIKGIGCPLLILININIFDKGTAK